MSFKNCAKRPTLVNVVLLTGAALHVGVCLVLARAALDTLGGLLNEIHGVEFVCIELNNLQSVEYVE